MNTTDVKMPFKKSFLNGFSSKNVETDLCDKYKHFLTLINNVNSYYSINS